MRACAGISRAQDLRRDQHHGAPSAPLRVQLPLRTDAHRQGTADIREIARRKVRRDDRAARPPVVLRRAVPSRVQIEAAPPASAVCELHRGQPPAQDAARSHTTGRSRHRLMRETTRVMAGAVALGGGAPLALIAGPCVIESEAHASMIAESLVTIASRCGVPLIFKASYDKANRTSLKSFRGPGIEEGLKVLSGIKRRLGVPILTDIHDANQAAPVAEVADVLQIPAFLSRQTDLIVAAAKTGRPINLKKGKFLAPDDMKHAIAKVVESGNPQVFVTERGFSFGYNNLVVDMRAFPMLRALGYPVVFDATHSLQLPGGGDGVTAGQAQYISTLASAAGAAGVDGVFLEVHDNPAVARSDAQNALPLNQLESLLKRLVRLYAAARDDEESLVS